MYKIGIDLGGTNIATAVVTDDFQIIGKANLPTNAPRAAEAIARDMAKTVEMAIADAGISKKEIDWIGVGSPGAVNVADGVIEYSCNLEFHSVPLRAMIEELTGIKCYLENDANAAAYGEFLAGAGKGVSDFIAVTLGTGVGGGIIIKNKIFSGSNCFGGELGHMVIRYNGVQCGCGRRGCWEAYASATALINQTIAAMKEDPSSKMWEIAPELSQVNGKTAFDGMRMGDETAAKVVDQYIRYVACGIADIINVFQPELICIGGGISKEKDNLILPVKKYVSEEVYTKFAKKQTEIKAAQLGNDAGIIGAAMLGRLDN